MVLEHLSRLYLNKNAFESKANHPLVLTLTLVLKLDLDMVLIYHCAKKKFFIPSASKVTARTDTQTQTDRHTRTQTDRLTNRHDKNITSPHMQAVIIPIHLNLMANSTIM